MYFFQHSCVGEYLGLATNPSWNLYFCKRSNLQIFHTLSHQFRILTETRTSLQEQQERRNIFRGFSFDLPKSPKSKVRAGTLSSGYFLLTPRQLRLENSNSEGKPWKKATQHCNTPNNKKTLKCNWRLTTDSHFHGLMGWWVDGSLLSSKRSRHSRSNRTWAWKPLASESWDWMLKTTSVFQHSRLSHNQKQIPTNLCFHTSSLKAGKSKFGAWKVGSPLFNPIIHKVKNTCDRFLSVFVCVFLFWIEVFWDNILILQPSRSVSPLKASEKNRIPEIPTSPGPGPGENWAKDALATSVDSSNCNQKRRIV